MRGVMDEHCRERRQGKVLIQLFRLAPCFSTRATGRLALRICGLLLLMSSIGMTQLANAAVTYVQGIAGNGSSSGSSWSTTFASAQTAGNLNVVAIGWADATRTVTSVVDSKGNTYTLAVGPARSTGNATEYIYYAKNIVAAAAGTNTVTVTVSGTGTIVWPDIRVAEYSGLDTSNPLDVAIGNSGSGTTATTGNFTTTNASDLIVGYAFIQNTVTGAGSGYTSRVPDGGDMLEDRTTTSAGTYSATAPIDISGWWVMSAVAFKAASTGDTQAPTAPTGLSATAASSSQINLSWTASTDNVAVTNYLVERCSGAGCSTFTQVATPTGTSYNDTGLAASNSFTYRVRAQDAVPNLSAYSSTATATTQAAGDTQAPTQPSGLAATAASSTQINLTWTASTDNVAVTAYRVERCSGAGCSTFTQVAAPTGTSYNDTALSASTSYTYRVRAQDVVPNFSTYSSTASATTQSSADTQAPTVPASPMATAVSSSQINLSWAASTDNVGVSGYRVERCQGAGCSSFTLAGSPTGNSFTDTGLTASTSYTYRVQALDAATNASSFSITSSATTSLGGPPSITYQYDDLGRIKAAIYSDDGTRSDFTFDAAGNRQTVASSGPTGAIQITSAIGSLAENGGSVPVVVSRTGGTFGAASVAYTTSSGGATAPTDFTTTSGTLNWTDGESVNKTINVPIIDDTTYEGNETFTLTLSSATGANLGSPVTQTITILDNEVAQNGTLSFSAANYPVVEGNTTVTVSVTRSGGTDGAISVQYNANTGTASSGTDYTATSNTLTWAAGDNTAKTFLVTILEDTAVEPSETVNLTLSSPTGGAVIGTGTSTITIADNEPGTLQLTASNYPVTENNGTVSVSVSRSAGSYGAASVTYSTTNGSAIAPNDYSTTTNTLSWASGDSSTKTFTIPINDDTTFEPTETFTVSLSGASGASLGSQNSATVTVSDNDPQQFGTLALSSTTYSVLEANTTTNITVVRTGGTDGAVSVQYGASNGTAGGTDYTVVPGTLNWNNGEGGAKTFPITILEDSTFEPAETVNITLSNVGGGAALGTSSATLTINDNEPGTLQFSPASYNTVENNGTVPLTVTRTNGGYGTVTVNYATATGTAGTGDFNSASSSLSWGDGDMSNRTISITLVNDTTYENTNESFTVALSSPTGGATIAGTNPATVTISDDDGPGTPTNLRSNPAGNPTILGDYTILWDPSSGPVTRYELERDINPADWATPNWSQFSLTPPTTSQGFTAGAAEKWFDFRVRACNGAVCSSWVQITREICPVNGCL
jgi:hypothetical protein